MLDFSIENDIKLILNLINIILKKCIRQKEKYAGIKAETLNKSNLYIMITNTKEDFQW